MRISAHKNKAGRPHQPTPSRNMIFLYIEPFIDKLMSGLIPQTIKSALAHILKLLYHIILICANIMSYRQKSPRKNPRAFYQFSFFSHFRHLSHEPQHPPPERLFLNAAYKRKSKIAKTTISAMFISKPQQSTCVIYHKCRKPCNRGLENHHSHGLQQASHLAPDGRHSGNAGHIKQSKDQKRNSA